MSMLAKGKMAAMTAAKVAGGQAMTLLDASPAHRFFVYLEINGLVEAGFTNITGLSMERDVEDFPEGGLNDRIHKLPGRFKQSRVTLKRGVSFSPVLWEWFFKDDFAEKMSVKKTNMSIIQFSSYSIVPVRWYNLEDAYPAKWSISDFDAGSAQISIETVEIVYSKLTVDAISSALANL
ncbi:MAG: phage tail protein [Ardenticatenales bacterium]|nr:phage tail protein [Ardenticatenales bacterium]